MRKTKAKASFYALLFPSLKPRLIDRNLCRRSGRNHRAVQRTPHFYYKHVLNIQTVSEVFFNDFCCLWCAFMHFACMRVFVVGPLPEVRASLHVSTSQQLPRSSHCFQFELVFTPGPRQLFDQVLHTYILKWIHFCPTADPVDCHTNWLLRKVNCALLPHLHTQQHQ